MRTILAIGIGGLVLAGCAASAPPLPGVAPPTRDYGDAGLERVMGQHAEKLEHLFGRPDADVTEGRGRKLQFGSNICVLDAYLYPPKGGGKPVVTHIDARQRDGSPIDRASCIAALSRRRGGR